MLRTIGDAHTYILELPKRRGQRGYWKHAKRLLMDEAGATAVTQQVHLALAKDDKLDVFAFENITSARRWRG